MSGNLDVGDNLPRHYRNHTLELLRREFRVLKAHSGEEGFRLMQEEEVHIVMSDQRMPQITGIELLTKLKARYPQAIRMLFTGFADLESIIAAINQGHIFQFMRKPWQPEELLAAVRQAAARVRSSRDDGDGARAPAGRSQRAEESGFRTRDRSPSNAHHSEEFAGPIESGIVRQSDGLRVGPEGSLVRRRRTRVGGPPPLMRGRARVPDHRAALLPRSIA